jgi:hypothetical protein
MINGDSLRQIDSSFLLTLVLIKEKGGIHAINRIFMETFGRYRLTGLLHPNICDTSSCQAIRSSGGFFLPLF